MSHLTCHTSQVDYNTMEYGFMSHNHDVHVKEVMLAHETFVNNLPVSDSGFNLMGCVCDLM